MLKQRLEIFDFIGDEDHRLRKLQRAPVYYTPLGSAKADDGVEQAWQRLTRPHTPEITTLTVQGRTLDLLAVHDTARTNFSDLCARTLGPADYLEIAQNFTTLFLENVPVMGPENRNEAKRFITLIDALYEMKTKLIHLGGRAARKTLRCGRRRL